MTPRFAWLVFGIAVALGFCIGARAWDAATFGVLGLLAGAPPVVRRVQRAGELERWCEHRPSLSSRRESS